MGARTRIVRATGPRGVVRTKTKFQVGEIVDMVAKRRGETHAVAKVVHGACSFCRTFVLSPEYASSRSRVPCFRCLQRSSKASTRRNGCSLRARWVSTCSLASCRESFAYGGFSLLGANYGPGRSSLVMYMAPIASVLLSSLVLRESPPWPTSPVAVSYCPAC